MSSQIIGIQLFVKQIVRANNTEIINAPALLTLCKGKTTGHRGKQFHVMTSFVDTRVDIASGNVISLLHVYSISGYEKITFRLDLSFIV